MANTTTPESTVYHDGFRHGMQTLRLRLNSREELERAVAGITDYDDAETYKEAFHDGREHYYSMLTEIDEGVEDGFVS